ncbi:MAG: phosphohydrolase [Deinococcales bacterium]|nr:phosphohydrolase [Deinococcales bacterium]
MRLLVIADAVSPVVYSNNFPENLAPFDAVLSAGDIPGYLLEFIATKTRVPPVYVFGNHAYGVVRDPQTQEERPPGGSLDAHLKVVEVAGLLVAGVEGSLRYRPGPHQYTQAQYRAMTRGLYPRLLWNRWRRGRAVDVLLTHAPPVGPNAGDDRVHGGVEAFNEFHRLWRPRLHVHGHVHLSGANARREYVTPEGVRVVNAYDFALVEL